MKIIPIIAVIALAGCTTTNSEFNFEEHVALQQQLSFARGSAFNEHRPIERMIDSQGNVIERINQ